MARTLVNSVDITPATTAQVGDVVQSMLTEAQFQAIRGTDWVLADGRTAAGTEYNSVTGNANIPDMRGQFLRGKNNGRADGNENPDGDVALGVWQADALGSHNHRQRVRQAVGNPGNISVGFGTVSGGEINSAQFTGNSGSNETRVKNVTVNIFIKIN